MSDKSNNPGDDKGISKADSEANSNASSKPKKSFLARVEQGLFDFYVTPYRRSFARAQRDEEDLFMLLIFADSLGVPNPAAYYTLEMLPLIYDRFHEWHTRMGMERSPLDHISCC